MKVKKKGGKREQFVKEKIVVAVIKTGSKPETARWIAQDVERALTDGVVVNTQQIRAEILKRLKQKDARAYRSWLSYDKQNK
jgi:transcriptional regulator NrdR family protein